MSTSDFRFTPPFNSSKTNATQYTRGAIRKDGMDVIITGPKMRVLFGECRWSKILFAVEDDQAFAFRDWLRNITSNLEKDIRDNPEKFKTTAKSMRVDHEVSQLRGPVELYPEELRANLSVYRIDDANEVVNTIIVHAETGAEIESHEVKANSYMTPVFKVSYYQMGGEKFGLVLTMLKGRYYPPARGVDNRDWIIDSDDNN